jgi:rubrerythrin
MDFKENKGKELVCRQCNTYLSTDDLENGKCPNCENDEDIFIYELDE